MGGGGGVLPISHSLAALVKHIRSIDHLLLTPTVYRKGYTYWSIDQREKGGWGGGGGGDNFCGRGTISASGLRPWGTISASRLCPGGQNLRGDRICSDTGPPYVCTHALSIIMCRISPNIDSYITM